MSVFADAVSGFYRPDQFEKIRNTTIGFAGAGGIGSNCAAILVRCGFSNFTIADFDIVVASNLNRQQYNSTHIGKPKVECLKDVLLSINPDLSINTVFARVQKDNITELFNACSVIIEAFDCAESKALLFSTYLRSNKFIIGASGVGGIGNSHKIRVLHVSDNVAIVGDGVSEVNRDVKPYAPKVTAVSAMMADSVLCHILN